MRYGSRSMLLCTPFFFYMTFLEGLKTSDNFTIRAWDQSSLVIFIIIHLSPINIFSLLAYSLGKLSRMFFPKGNTF